MLNLRSRKPEVEKPRAYLQSRRIPKFRTVTYLKWKKGEFDRVPRRIEPFEDFKSAKASAKTVPLEAVRIDIEQAQVLRDDLRCPLWRLIARKFPKQSLEMIGEIRSSNYQPQQWKGNSYVNVNENYTVEIRHV